MSFTLYKTYSGQSMPGVYIPKDAPALTTEKLYVAVSTSDKFATTTPTTTPTTPPTTTLITPPTTTPTTESTAPTSSGTPPLSAIAPFPYGDYDYGSDPAGISYMPIGAIGDGGAEYDFAQGTRYGADAPVTFPATSPATQRPAWLVPVFIVGVLLLIATGAAKKAFTKK